MWLHFPRKTGYKDFLKVCFVKFIWISTQKIFQLELERPISRCLIIFNVSDDMLHVWNKNIPENLTPSITPSIMRVLCKHSFLNLTEV